MSQKPVLATTLGDAAGIGPELTVKSLNDPETTEGLIRLIVGPKRLFQLGCEIADTDIELPVYEDAESAVADGHGISLVDLNPTGFDQVELGSSSMAAGALDLAIGCHIADLCSKGVVNGFVFAPVNKQSLKMGGSKFEGYKAYIANHVGSTGLSAEINTIGHLWTTRVSSHIAIADVPNHVTKENILEIVRYFDRELRRFNYTNPKIAVSGLNPHNGDNGMFGREEIDHIRPAVEEAGRLGISVDGPFPPDTIFLTAQEKEYLGIVSMYHDQCQIATKLLGFDDGVTYFGGLPFPITTPAHGTAYDIAGKGIASPKPLNSALKLMRRSLLASKELNK